MSAISVKTAQASIYLTARDPRTGKSKTITVRGQNLTCESVIALVESAIKRRRKAD